MGWFTDSSFSPPPFSNGTVVNEDITLYAKWQVKPEVQVDVTLNLNYDGAPAPTVVSIAKGETLYAENPTRDEYEFKGWYLEATLETPFDVTTQINEDITLYANGRFCPSCASSFPQTAILTPFPQARLRAASWLYPQLTKASP